MNNFSNINDRILYIIENQCNGNQKKFADLIKFSPQVVGNIVSGRKSKPSFDVLYSILSSFVDIDSDWLILGKGEMLKSEIKSAIDAPNPIRDKLIARQDQLIEKLEKENKELQNQIEALKKRQANFDLQRVAENDPKLTKKNK